MNYLYCPISWLRFTVQSNSLSDSRNRAPVSVTAICDVIRSDNHKTLRVNGMTQK